VFSRLHFSSGPQSFHLTARRIRRPPRRQPFRPSPSHIESDGLRLQFETHRRP
jgi:hypothetical protein